MGQVEVEAFQESLIVSDLLEAAMIDVMIGHRIGDYRDGGLKKGQSFVTALSIAFGANIAMGTF